MNRTASLPTTLLCSATLLLSTILADARDFGVSTSSYGRGTKIETQRGGTAYVGPRGLAAQSAGGYTAAAGRRGAAYSGPNSSGVATRYGGVAVGAGGTVVATRSSVAPLPAGYIRVVPAGYRMVVYGGYNCYYAGGVYYRPVIYQGTTVYVVVR